MIKDELEVDDLDLNLDDLDENLIQELELEADIESTSKTTSAYTNSTEVSSYLKDIEHYPRITQEEEVDLAKLIQAGVEAKNLLTDTNQTELLPIIKAGQAAREKFISANYKLVVAIAKNYYKACTPSVTFLDLIQNGNLGLMKAVDRFDYTRGLKFSTYATWWIRQSIRRDLLNTGQLIRLPIHIQESLAKISMLEKHEKLSPEEIASRLKISVSKLARFLQIQDERAIVYLDKDYLGSTDSYVTMLDMIAGDTLAPNEAHELKERDRLLYVIMENRLTDREFYIIASRFGLISDQPSTLESIGNELGITRERVRQVEEKALRKLRSEKVQAEFRDVFNIK